MGMASPPYLVSLGLILPDSRMLCGVASIGLTLVNIAIILPDLRQPLLDSMHAREDAPSHVGVNQGQVHSSTDESHSTQSVTLNIEALAFALVSSRDNEHASAPLACDASVTSVCISVTGPSDVNFKVAPLPILPLTSEKIEADKPPQSNQSPHGGATDWFNSLLTRQGRSALYIPLPVPDAAEIAFFDSGDALLSNLDFDPKEVPVEDDTLLEEDSSMEDDLIAIEDIALNRRLLTADLLSPPGRILGQGFADVEMSVPDEYMAYIETILPPRIVPAERSDIEENEDLSKQRHESLKFIPQSVVSRYPSALVVSAGRFGEHKAIDLGRDNQPTPRAIGYNPTALSGGAASQVDRVAPEGHWRAAFFTEAQPSSQLIGGQTVVPDAILGQDQVPLPDSTLQELTTPRKSPSHTNKRRLGVLARAALRNRRFCARRCREDESDGSSASDSDSDSDSSGSQYSSGSSADSKSMLPLMLGADLLAALDANSESGLNLTGSGRTSCAPLTTSKELLLSEGSVANISIVMQVSSIDDGTDGEVKAPVMLRALTDEEIQQWASGVVQKCVRQVCRAREPADPLQSPSQVSDVCAEKPSGSGASQCPFSGLHCKLGASSAGHGPMPRANELPVSLPPTLILPARKVRSIHDIPEFVPRQRLVSMAAGRAEGLGTRSANVDMSRDAAAKVIARLECQAGFNSRHCLAGADKRKASTAARA